jgi:ubiquinone/menaquinone biosynthesis C-methylase UbiE
MPTVDWNQVVWAHDYAWNEAGEEWSAAWGGADAQWSWTVLPRIHSFVPAKTILEIGPGFGRWTARLMGLCQKLVLVDLSDKCIQACQARFRSSDHISYHVTDGKSLEMVPDKSIEFAFSFDSLVHAELDVLESYIGQLHRKLSPDGVAFIHHSNIGEFERYLNRVERIPWGKSTLQRWGVIEQNRHHRSLSVTAAKVEALVENAGMRCISQEIINWGSIRLIDCLSVFTPSGSRWERPNRVLRNKGFMAEAANAAKLAKYYTLDRRPSPAA